MKRMTKKMLSLLLAIVMLSSAFCMNASADDAFLLEEDSRYSGYLSAGEYFWCMFIPQETGRHFIESVGDYDTYITLYDANQNVIASDDDDGYGNNFRLCATLTAGRTYYYQIEFFSSSTSGTLEFDFQGRAFDATPNTSYNSSTYEGGSVWYRLVPTVTTLFALESKGSGDTEVALYDSALNLIDSDDDGGYGLNFKLTKVLTAGKTYYYTVKHHYVTASGVIDYAIYDASYALTANYTFTCTVDSGRTQFASFVPQRTTCYTIGSISETDTYFNLYDSRGNLIVSDDNTGENGDFMVSRKLNAGTPYYFEFRYASELDSGMFRIAFQEEYYPDVAATTWFYDAVNYVTVNNFMTGYQNGKFGPADNLQRQDFVVALARIAGADLTPYQGQTGNLSDVKANSYYAAAVAWAVDNGIITGYQDGRFGVGDTITREQVCTIFYRYMNSPAVVDVDGTLSVFPDKAHVSGFAKTPMAWAIDNNIVSGMQNGHLAPTAGASRAQIATIIMRMDQSGMFA